MSRKQPEKPDNDKPWPPVVKKQDGQPERTVTYGKTQAKIVVQTRQYKLITPLFGGGVKPGVNDLDNLIRATEIRGQLRFWWRAIRGGQPQFEGKLAKMKAFEDEIWGAASNTQKPEEGEKKEKGWRGTVQIEVEILNGGKSKKPFIPQWNAKRTKVIAPSDPDVPGYAAFPLRPPEDELKSATRLGKPEDVFVEDLREGIEFLLSLSFPEKWSTEVNAALWAWETFGGVGARTRRGFGALLLEKINRKDVEDNILPPDDAAAAKTWITKKIAEFQKQQGKTLTNVPRIHAAINICVLGPYSRPANAWQKLIGRLHDFRQQRYDFKAGKSSPFGKSLWPEANALRRRLHPNQARNSPPDTFPRAAFGLPIVFHLAHERPSQTITLQGIEKESERWASRLILKPLPCRGKQFLGLAALLDGSELPAEGLALVRDENRNERLGPTIAADQTKIRTEELPQLLKDAIGDETDILRAFLNYLKKEGK